MQNRLRLAVALGGAVGSLGRVGVAELIGSTALPLATAFPWATLVVNVTGTLALAAASHRLRDPVLRAGLLTGALGAWTTVSAFAVETIDLGDAGDALVAVTYVVVTVVAGVVAASFAPATGPRDGAAHGRSDEVTA